MQKFIFTLFPSIFLNFMSEGQNLPSANIDSSRYETKMGIEIEKDLNQFDQYIFYCTRSAWTKSTTFVGLGKRKGKWKQATYNVKYKGNHYTNQFESKIERKIKPVQSKDVQSFFDYLDSVQFLSQDLNKLNDKFVLESDSAYSVVITTDGATEMFYIRTKSGIFSIHAYMPEYYQKVHFMEERSIFLACKKKLLLLIE